VETCVVLRENIINQFKVNVHICLRNISKNCLKNT